MIQIFMLRKIAIKVTLIEKSLPREMIRQVEIGPLVRSLYERVFHGQGTVPTLNNHQSDAVLITLALV